MPDGWVERAEEASISIERGRCEPSSTRYLLLKLRALDVKPPQPTSQTQSDALFYVLAALAGVASGWVDVAVNDLLLTALLVLAACITLGLMRPQRPWRWVVVG